MTSWMVSEPKKELNAMTQHTRKACRVCAQKLNIEYAGERHMSIIHYRLVDETKQLLRDYISWSVYRGIK